VSGIVVFVHGLWLSGLEAFVLRRRVAAALGCAERNFRHRSMSATLADSAAALGAYLRAMDADPLHLIGHSMGGLVILKLFEGAPALPAGRIVLLGTPIQGSSAALGLARLPGGKWLLGRGMAEAMAPAMPRRWRAARDIGIIAGDSPYGLGRLVARFDGPNDGVVSVEETRLAGATDRIVLSDQHAGLLYSREAARQTAAFLAHGRFAR